MGPEQAWQERVLARLVALVRSARPGQPVAWVEQAQEVL
jgi:hypothetical protein